MNGTGMNCFGRNNKPASSTSKLIRSFGANPLLLALTFLVVVFCSDIAYSVSASGIETVMRKYQNKYHYVAVVKDSDSKYIGWPSFSDCNCSGAPSHPINFYGDITEAQANTLVNGLVNVFYNSSVYSIYSNFIEDPEGQERVTYVSVTEPDSTDSWQDKLAQVSGDIDKLTRYRVSVGKTAWLNKSGSGYSTDCFWSPCNGGDDVEISGSFSEAKGDAEYIWSQSTSSSISSGISINSAIYHSCDDYCDTSEDYTGHSKDWTAFIASSNFKFDVDLRKHTGSATCYVKASKEDDANPEGDPKVSVTIDDKYHSWKSASVGSEWISEYLFAETPPVAVDPGGTTCTGTDSDSNSYNAGWVYSGGVVGVSPNFPSATDPYLGCAAPSELVYKSHDKHIAYSAGDDCGHDSGETVRGWIIVNGYKPSMKVEVKLNSTFSGKTAKLVIGTTEIDPDDTDQIYCFSPVHGTTEPNYVPFSISAYTGEDQVSFSITSVYAESLGDTASDPNEAQRVKVYRGQGEDIVFQITTNGYECCNRKDNLTDNAFPQISKHENGDIEIKFPDIEQAYIYRPAFLDMSISGYIPEGGVSGEYIQLRASAGNTLIYSIDSNWSATGVAASASFVDELDADGNVIKTAGYDTSGRLDTISDAADPVNFYRQFNYDDTANPNRITSYADYAGDVSRTYTLVYDETTGRLAGTIGGTSSGCSSCSLPGQNMLYTFNDFGSVLTASDIESNIIYEYEYDTGNRLVAKWLGAKESLEPIQEIVYDPDADDFGGEQIRDIYDYTTDGDYHFTRKVLDSNGQVITKITFDNLNIDSSAISTDPNVIIASGGHITTYGHEYSGTTLQSFFVKSPAFNDGTINTYYKNTLNNSLSDYEKNILVTVDANDVEEETEISRSEYEDYTLNGVSVKRLQRTYDWRGLQESKYTLYDYDSNGQVDSMKEPGVYQLNDDYTELNYAYTFYADGSTETETVSNDVGNDNYNGNDTKSITTYFYNHLGHSTGMETLDGDDNLLNSTISKSNGFGEEIYRIDNSGVARGKEYDAYGKLVSNFVFADADDTALFDGNDPNILTEDISGVYANLTVVSQTRRVYDTLGRLSEVKTAVADDVFAYDTPDSWHVTYHTYDSYGRKYQKYEISDGIFLMTSYEYNNQGQIVKTNYPDGRWQKQLRNGRGLVRKTIAGYGPENTDPNDFVITETLYNSDGNVLKELKAGIIVTSYELDDQGMVYRRYQGDYETDYCSYIQYNRDIAGNVSSQKTVDVDNLGNETIISKSSTRYNVIGEVTQQTVIADPNTLDGMEDRVKLFSYDVNGRQIETVTKADGNDQIYTDIYEDTVEYQAGDKIQQSWYDLAGKLIYGLKFEYAGDIVSSYDLPFNDIDDALLYTKESRQVSISRNSYTDGRLLAVDTLVGFDEDDPDFDDYNYPQAGLLWKQTSGYEYDDTGRISKSIDADDNFITFGYNSRGQQTKQTLWQGKSVFRLSDGLYDPSSFTAYPLTISLTGYDDAGRRSRTTVLSDPNILIDIDSVDLSVDNVTDYVYNDSGKLYRQRNYFDGAGQRIALKEYSYDGLGRVESIEYGELDQVFWGDGSLLLEDKYVQKTVGYFYNTKGEKVQQTLTNVNTLTAATADIDTDYSYDLQGRLEKIENAQGTTYLCKYDALGRKTEVTDATGKVTQYFYNSVGDLETKSEDPSGLDRQTDYDYDRFGRQTAIISGSDQTDYTYNYLDGITDVDSPDSDLSFDYDMQGKVLRRRATKDSQTTTTQYKRDLLGRVSYKQYFDGVEWSEPNNLLPFDEVLYDALGNKNIIAYIDGENDLELNMYSYNGLGAMTSAAETCDSFSTTVGYGYDQRGLLTLITYPNEKIAAYKRDALGRVESVTYDGKTIVTYGYLGDTIISKTMSDADVEYTAVVDALGRITGETFSNISDSQSFITNSYDYTNHSSRMDERNSTIYGFDTLGKLTAEDSTSYTSDILGNPTNASDDGLAYTLDNEDRIIDVNDVSGDVAEYDYDRLGRRSKKTVNNVDTNFVYDIMGNVIAEYENDVWTRDYIYGATGEAVYMQLPRTAVMNEATEDFWDFMTDFASAWLCEPNCTTGELAYDCDDPNQINLKDWPCNIDDYDLSDVFNPNGRYLLTDFRNSVIATADIDTVTEITYDAWGTPSYTGSIDGLSILWNGYHYDRETDNYYLRNRYYSPLERRFLTEDPRGINPDGNWNNPLLIKGQYDDGYGLQVYAQGDPVNGFDFWGLLNKEILEKSYRVGMKYTTVVKSKSGCIKEIYVEGHGGPDNPILIGDKEELYPFSPRVHLKHVQGKLCCTVVITFYTCYSGDKEELTRIAKSVAGSNPGRTVFAYGCDGPYWQYGWLRSAIAGVYGECEGSWVMGQSNRKSGK